MIRGILGESARSEMKQDRDTIRGLLTCMYEQAQEVEVGRGHAKQNMVGRDSYDTLMVMIARLW